MAAYDFSAPRLYVDCALDAGVALKLDRSQQNYLGNVLRLSEGDEILIFNGCDGEWRARIAEAGRRSMSLRAEERVRAQTPAGDLHYLFAPLKHARLDYMVQKAVEMGVTCLRPVSTRRTQASRVNADRMRANAIEAAEQCGILAVPEIREIQSLSSVLSGWPAGRTLVFCDEDAQDHDAIEALRTRGGDAGIGILIGPEGGFDPAEREEILAIPSALRLSLGPRILRADTAAVCALTLVQAAIGDWPRGSSRHHVIA